MRPEDLRKLSMLYSVPMGIALTLYLLGFFLIMAPDDSPKGPADVTIRFSGASGVAYEGKYEVYSPAGPDEKKKGLKGVLGKEPVEYILEDVRDGQTVAAAFQRRGAKVGELKVTISDNGKVVAHDEYKPAKIAGQPITKADDDRSESVSVRWTR